MKIIKWHRKALKQLRKISNSKIESQIYDAVQELKAFPNCNDTKIAKNIKKLTNRDDYRLRVGNYRVLFTDDLKIINIEEVKIRDERTY